MAYPRIHLAIDNCFGSKRWTAPQEWAAIVKELGLRLIEVSTDNESDPLYTDPGYLKDWLKEVRRVCEQSGVRAVNLYSGHGTYTTLGLAHTDPRNQDRIQGQWLQPLIDNAAHLGAGVGFYCHAFSQQVLQDPAAYSKAEQELYGRLAELAHYAGRRGVKSIGVEQMYSPHQIPWTIEGARKLLREVYARRASPLYLTLDTGHQAGQRRFLRPSVEKLKQALVQFRAKGKLERGLWLGSDSAYALFREAAVAPRTQEDAFLQRLEEELDGFPHLFALPEDGDTYVWLERLARYSPIIHLQQTDGKSSLHWPFTEDYNRPGIVQADRILRAIAASYSQEVDPGMPPPCEDLYLTIEIFPATASLPVDIISDLVESVNYWRRHVREDGLTLDELI